eukprot:TRINITY_DN1427_c0_g1_i7.p1 TRINITY_DN1427_c0_g1~~TRINITY_DN1427_c0_g1_i7.p1  ORF type:complete len:246 (+),score=81.58 TRINITY_DN1427_c0_g1_i7:66-740(+)
MGQTDAKLADATGLEKYEVAKLRSKYQMLCRDHGTGPKKKLTKAQFLSHFPSSGHAQADIIFDVFDSHNTGEIDFKEFCMAMSTLMYGEKEEKLRFAFDMWDTGNTGYITQDEFKAIIRTFHRSFGKLLQSVEERSGMTRERHYRTQAQLDDAAETLFVEADTVGDGRLSYDEFRVFAERHPDAFVPLDSVLKGVKSASGWDWETPSGPAGPKPSLTSDACCVQ